MKHTRANQKGFSITIVLVVIVVIVGLAFGGWYVWDKNKQDDNRKDQSTTQTKNSEQKDQEDPYEGWQMYTNATYGVSFKYPTTWQIEETPLDAPSSATKQKYAINLKRLKEVKYNGTVNIEILDEKLANAAEWYDNYFAQSSSNQVNRTTNQLKGTNSVQYAVVNSGVETKLYLFSIGGKTYLFSSINEELNFQTDPDYWTNFGKVLDSLRLTLSP